MLDSRRVLHAAVAIALVVGTAGSVVGVSLVLDAHADTATVTVTPTDDSYIHSAAKTTSFGTDVTMRSNGASAKVQRAYFKFTVPQLPPSATLVAASLAVTATNSS